VSAGTTANVELPSMGQAFGALGAPISITGTTGVTFKGPLTFSSFVTINANTVALTGGDKQDIFEIKGTGSTATKLTASGNLGFVDGNQNDIAYVSTAVTTTKEVDLSGISGQVGGSFVVYGMTYANGSPSVAGNNNVTTIKGSSTRDFIIAPKATDGVTISGGAGADIFYIPTDASNLTATAVTTASGTNTLTTPVVITDFSSSQKDQVVFEATNTTSPLVGLFLRGSYDSATKIFTNNATNPATTGADTLYYSGTQAVVLLGYQFSSSTAGENSGQAVPVVVIGVDGEGAQGGQAFTGLLGTA